MRPSPGDYMTWNEAMLSLSREPAFAHQPVDQIKHALSRVRDDNWDYVTDTANGTTYDPNIAEALLLDRLCVLCGDVGSGGGYNFYGFFEWLTGVECKAPALCLRCNQSACFSYRKLVQLGADVGDAGHIVALHGVTSRAHFRARVLNNAHNFSRLRFDPRQRAAA